MSWIRAIAPLALLGLIGCGSEDDRITLVPVTGTVTKNGKPLAGATISFLPDATNKDSTPGVDATGPEGNYKLMWRNRTGVAPGKYKVSIAPAFGSTGPIDPAFADDPYMAQVTLEASPSYAAAVSKKKAAGEKSEFDAEVSDKGEVLDFDVKSSSK